MRRRIAALFLVFAFLLADAAPTAAQGLSIIRDAEIEQSIRTMSAPIFKAAGFDPDRINLIIVNSNSVNAFVAGGMNIFMHTGFLMETENPLELLGVIAHETGHISGGHLVRGRGAAERAGTVAAVTTVLGLLAAAAAGDPDAALAVIGGGQQIAMGGFLANSRSMENQADQAALKFLEEAEISAAGLLRFFEKLEEQELLPASQQVEWVRTHPLTRDRVEATRAAVERMPEAPPLPASFDRMHDRMRAKLIGYLRPHRETLRLYPEDDPSITARYARAIALYRANRPEEALAVIDGLIAAEPDNPFFHELKGQVLFENGKVVEALAPYRRATELMPEAGLLHLALAHALIESGQPGSMEEALNHLKAAEAQEGRTPALHRFMGIAYGRLGQTPMAELHLAEEALLQGRSQDAIRKARMALDGLKPGTPQWYQAQDILVLVDPRLDAANLEPVDE